MLHLAELVSYMYITRHSLCSRYYLITFILQKLSSVTMKTKSIFMKTECEIFFLPSLSQYVLQWNHQNHLLYIKADNAAMIQTLRTKHCLTDIDMGK